MQNLSVEMHVAADGQEAIDFIARAETDPEAPVPDFLLLDLNLPKRDGFEILTRLRSSSRFSKLPVLVMTSSNSAEDQMRAAELGARYFRKTADYGEFLKLGVVLKQFIEECRG